MKKIVFMLAIAGMFAFIGCVNPVNVDAEKNAADSTFKADSTRVADSIAAVADTTSVVLVAE
jgi:hypothetical protein